MLSPTSLAAQAVSRGKSNGAQKLWQSFDFRNKDAHDRIRGSFGWTTVAAARRAVLDHPSTVQQFYIVDCATDTIVPFMNPIITGAGVLGNSTDWIEQINPIRIPLTAFHGSVITLVPTAVAKKVGWPYASEPAPDFVPGPGPTVPATSTATATATTTTAMATATATNLTEPELAAQTAPSFGRLKFYDEPTVLPVFTVVPLALPIPIGFDVPESWPLNVPFPATITTIFPEVEAWRKSLSYLRSKNESKSLLTYENRLFNIDYIADNLQPQQLTENFSLQDTLDYEVVLLRRGSPEFNQVAKLVQSEAVAAYTRIGLAMPPPPSSTVGTSTTASAVPPAPLQDVLAQAILQLSSSKSTASTSLTEREHQVKARETIAKYELALAWPETIANKTSLQFPTITTEFRNFLEKTSSSDAARRLTMMMESARKFARSNAAKTDPLLFWADFTSEQFDRPVASGLREFLWLHESLNMADKRPLHQLTILCFLPPNVDALDFKERAA
jgi:hypothetical protein